LDQVLAYNKYPTDWGITNQVIRKQNNKKMKATILTQKNVCAILGLIMALTILWSAKAEAQVDQINEVIPSIFHEGLEVQEEEIIPSVELDILELKAEPTITLIDKYGEVVAEFYGEKSELKKRFNEAFQKGNFVTAHGNHEFYLVR
jgi:hypothetical protein